MAKEPTFTDQIRKCIETCGRTRYAIAIEAGIQQATLSRFMNGKGGMSMEGLDALAACIGMRATLTSKKGGK